MANNTKRNPSAPWSITVFTVGDIPLRIHVSFFLLLAYVALVESAGGGDVVIRVLFVVSIFACVALHELGHALVAKFFNIKTRDIVLYPFGGIASLLGQGLPKQEFFIALAGPLVNLLIAVLLTPFTQLTLDAPTGTFQGFLTRVFYTNLILALFNMVPALPMDGGRVFRAILAMCGIKKATLIAARLSQFICVLMGLYAFFSGNIILIIVAVLVFSHAVQEHMRERTLTAAVGLKVRDVMTDIELLHCFTHGTTVSQALRIALKSFQSVFPVVHGGEVIGIVSRNDVLQSGALDAEEAYIASLMTRDFSVVGPEESVATLIDRLSSIEGEAALVLEERRLIGILIKEKVIEFLLVQEYRKRTLEQAKTIESDI